MDTPNILYRYRPSLTRELDALCCSHIYLSDPKGFDDPWDCALLASAEAQAAVSGLRVACFAIDDSDTRFWSHYATYHNGICIGYRTDQLPVDSSQIYQVSYSDAHPGFPDGLDKESPGAFEAAAHLLTTKCVAWGPQHEWRVILPVTDCGYLEHDQDAIASVTFGLRTHPTVRQYLVNRLGFNPSIEFRVIEKVDGTMVPVVNPASEFPDVNVDPEDASPYVPDPESDWT
jgi:hypothetical protein